MEQILKILNLIFFSVMIIINALGEYMPLGVGSTGSISARYPNLFTPAPMTFSIWGVIYLLVAVFIAYQLYIDEPDSYTYRLVGAIGFWFILSCIMNMGWMISWHNNMIWLSLIFMVGLLITLIQISSKFQSVDNPSTLGTVSAVGFNIYLGWICAATIANISVFLVQINWNRFGLSEQFWTMVMILIGAFIGILFIALNRNYVAAGTIIWAYSGILVKHISQNGFSGKYPLIIATVICSIAIILATYIIKIFQLKNA